MESIASLKKALKAHGLDHTTPGLKGKKRRAELQTRLQAALEHAEIARLQVVALEALSKRGLSTETRGHEASSRSEVLYERWQRWLAEEELQAQAKGRLDAWRRVEQTGSEASPERRRAFESKQLKQEERDEALNSAIVRLNFPEIEDLCARGSDVNYETRGGHTALLRAVHFNRMLVVRNLIEKYGACTEKENKKGTTPLIWVIMKGTGGGRRNLESTRGSDGERVVPAKGGGTGNGGGECLAMIRHLLSLGADPSFETTTGKTAMLTAVEYGRMDVIELLLDRAKKVMGQRADVVLSRTNMDGISPLLQAVMSRQREIVQRFIQLGADQFQRDGEGRDAMAWAQLRSFGDIVRILKAFISYPAMVQKWNDSDALLKTKLMDRALMNNDFPVA